MEAGGMPPRWSHALLLLVLLAGLAGCATRTLWRDYGPDSYVEVPAADVDPATLDREGVEHRLLPNGNRLVPRRGLDRVGAYAVLIFATPVTVVVDAAVTVTVVGLACVDARFQAKGRNWFVQGRFSSH
jgi:hypothetical protein